MKKLRIGFLSIFALLVCLCILPTEAKAAGTIDLTFTLNSDGESYAVTDCSTSASGSLEIPATYEGKPVTSIGSYAFSNCTSLASITIPDSVTKIGSSAFSGCSSLESITIPFVGGSKKTDSSTYQYPFGYIFGTSSYTGGVATEQEYYGSSIYITTPETFYIPASLKSVTVTGGNILWGAFFNCAGLTSITIPDGITNIGEYAFYQCSSLTGIAIPESVESIGYDAFRGCSRMASVYITDIEAWCQIGFENVASNPLYNCYNLYLGDALVTDVIISNGVDSIGQYAFYNCSSLTSVAIPNSVTNIGNSAFYNCTGLTNITISNGVTSIGDNAFEGCSSLTSITIPDSVQSIGHGAFYKCSSLIDITVPSSVKSIGAGAFGGCNSLKSITIPFIGDSKKQWSDTYRYPLGYIFGTSSASGGVATKQYYYGYSCSETTSTTYYIPESLKSVTVTGGNIYYGAFSNCTGLTNVTIGDGVYNIASGAFVGCNGLKSLTIPFVGGEEKKATDTYQYPFGFIFGTESYTGGVATKQYYYGSSTTSLTSSTYYIPESLKSVTVTGGNILYGAFEQCANLTSITIPDSAKSIAAGAFRGTGLTSFTIPSGVTSIGLTAFGNCKSLTTVNFNATNCTSVPMVSECVFFGCTKLTTVNIGENVKKIPYGMFYRCTGLTSVTISSGVTSIGDAAFSNCSSLAGITIPNGVKSIGGAAFSDCTALISITIPDSVESIDSAAFSGCTSLASVVIGNGVKSIGSSAFQKCTKLTGITIPNSVTSIGNNAFEYCSNLSSVVIGSGVQSIGDRAFHNCTNLTTVDFNATNCTSMGSASYPVFAGCTKLTTVNIGKNVTNIPANAFYNCSRLTNITIPEGVLHIGDSAFASCLGLCSITIPNSVQSIGEEAFRACMSLSSVNIGSGVTSIGKKAFHYCDNLLGVRVNANNTSYSNIGAILFNKDQTKLIMAPGGIYGSYTIPGGVTSIEDYAFSCCFNLTGVIMPDGLQSIGKEAFSSCSALTGVVMPSSVESVGNSAFNSCDSLNAVFYRGTLSQKEQIGISGYNGCLDEATWHYLAEDTVVAGQNCYYCALCDRSYLLDGTAMTGTVVFKDWDGTVLSEKTYARGDAVTPPADPTKAADKTFTYTFAGWDKDVVNCAGDVTYTATYTAKYIDYTVTFVDEDGTELSKKIYHWGDVVTSPVDPTKAADKTFTYTFAGWDKDVVNCAGDVTYTATYTAKYIDYTVTFVDEDSTELSKKTYHWGDVVASPADPTKAADKAFTYTFIGWDNEIVNCAGDATYTATYKPVYIDYTVVFKNSDGTVLSTETYHWGDKITPPENPTIEADNMYTYTFAGWYNFYGVCEGNATYTATYNGILTNYTVRFVDENGAEISSETYHWGDGITAPFPPDKAADEVFMYPFTGWDKELVCVGDMTIAPVYAPVHIEYMVVFKDWDGTVLSSEAYHWGDVLTPPEAPERDADETYTYTFTGWDKALVCAGDMTINATYKPTYINYTVVFKNWDGAVLSAETYHWGDVIQLPAAPVREKDNYYMYIFAGWGAEVSPCCGNAEYKAVFTAVHYHTYSAVCDPTCNLCGAVNNDALPHDFADATCTTPKTCKVCGATEGTALGHKYVILKFDEQTHWNECACGAIDEENRYGHGYTRYQDAQKHWLECYCGATTDVEDHDFADATCTTPKTCKVCGETQGEPLPHQYTELKFDEETHWNQCACGAIDETSRHGHNFVLFWGGVDHWQQCLTCGAEKDRALHDFEPATCEDPMCCKVCGTIEGEALGHTYTNSCDTSCNRCGAKRSIKHKYTNECDKYCNVCKAKRTAPHKYTNSCDTKCNLCSAKRTIKHTYSNGCDKSCNVCKAKRTTSHKYKTVTTRATLTRHGKVEKKCSVCGYVSSKTTIRYAKTIKLSATSYTYNGKVKTPTVTVKDSAGKTLKKNTDYTVSYSSGRKNVGTYKVTIKFKGKYSGTKVLTFKINPKAASINKLTAKTKGLYVKLNRQTVQSTGYEIQYSTAKSFKSAKAVTTGYKTSTKAISGLKGRTTYYVRVRTYKTVSGVKYYSNWSTAKYMKTK